ncbi:hypothetical protein WMY93_002452 [Mugilogobius chulae]|uniref:Urea transporter n=1 Tax=Mugilogobius chulae TaxID=88201 RepID=A0AAW0Q8R4_9GOBI
MWMDTKATPEDDGGGRDKRTGFVHKLKLCTGDMLHLDSPLQDRWWVVQLLVWNLRGVARVILANNPLSGALILAALCWASPWSCVLGSVGLLCSTLTAVVTGQDRSEVRGGLHGFNGMLVSLLMGVFSSAGDWYWPLLVPAVLCSATCVLLFSALAPLLDRWDLPVAVFPLTSPSSCSCCAPGPSTPTSPTLGRPAGSSGRERHTAGRAAGSSGHSCGRGADLCLCRSGTVSAHPGAVLLYSPLLAVHALLGSAVGTVAGLSMDVRSSSLYSGLSGFNGALGCMAVGGLFFTFS